MYGTVSEWQEPGCTATSWEWLHPRPHGAGFTDAVVDEDGTLWAVGENGTIARMRDGEQRVEIALVYPPVPLNGVWTDGREVIAVGSRGVEVRYAEGRWYFTEHDPAWDISHVFGPATDDLWYLVNDGTAVHYDGVSYAPHFIATDGLWARRGVWLGPNEAWIAILDGNTAHWDGEAWTIVPAISRGSGGMFSISAGKDGTLVVASGGGDVFMWTGSAWQPMDLPDPPSAAFNTFRGLYVENSSNIWLSACQTSARDAVLHFDGEEWTVLPHVEPWPRGCLAAVTRVQIASRHAASARLTAGKATG